MNKKIYYIIRYSVLQNSTAWVIARDNEFEDYKQKLFEDSRLELRYNLFSKLTLPSLVEQKRAENTEKQIVLLISTELPSAHKEQVKALSRQFEELIVLEVAPDSSLTAAITAHLKADLKGRDDMYFATVRIDDDDMLHNSVHPKISSHMTSDNVGKIVTFSHGYELLINASELSFSGAIKINYPKIALGLTHLSKLENGKVSTKPLHIYQAGKHTKIDEEFDLIDDKSVRAYIRVAYAEQDTALKGYNKRVKTHNSVDFSKLREDFPFVQCLTNNDNS